MKWGKDNESRAQDTYVAKVRNDGEEVTVRPTGLTLHPEMAFLGASADGLVTFRTADACSCGCLEIKCPFSIDGNSTVHLTPLEIAECYASKFCLVKGEDGEHHLNKSHAYFAQVQGEMAIMGLEWCDFVVFSGGDVVVDRVWFDPDFWQITLLPKLRSFYYNVAREILSGTQFLQYYGPGH